MADHEPRSSEVRQLRFSLFLQVFAGLMMGVAMVVRAMALGWDTVTLILLVAFLLIVAAGVFTFRRLRSTTPGNG